MVIVSEFLCKNPGLMEKVIEGNENTDTFTIGLVSSRDVKIGYVARACLNFGCLAFAGVAVGFVATVVGPAVWTSLAISAIFGGGVGFCVGLGSSEKTTPLEEEKIKALAYACLKNKNEITRDIIAKILGFGVCSAIVFLASKVCFVVGYAGVFGFGIFVSFNIAFEIARSLKASKAVKPVTIEESLRRSYERLKGMKDKIFRTVPHRWKNVVNPNYLNAVEYDESKFKNALPEDQGSVFPFVSFGEHLKKDSLRAFLRHSLEDMVMRLPTLEDAERVDKIKQFYHVLLNYLFLYELYSV